MERCSTDSSRRSSIKAGLLQSFEQKVVHLEPQRLTACHEGQRTSQALYDVLRGLGDAVAITIVREVFQDEFLGRNECNGYRPVDDRLEYLLDRLLNCFSERVSDSSIVQEELALQECTFVFLEGNVMKDEFEVVKPLLAHTG